MPLRRMQLAIRSLMIAVALVALNLGAINAVPEPISRYWMKDSFFHFSGPEIRDFPGDSFTCRFQYPKPRGSVFLGVDRIVEDPPLETLPQIWSPVVGSASVTLLVLALSLSGPISRRGGAVPRSGAAPTARPWVWW